MSLDPNTFTPRPYQDITRDLLTTLTGGTVAETHVVPAGGVIELRLLADRPIRRVSHLEGVIEVQRQAIDALGNLEVDIDGNPVMETVAVPHRFGDSDFETFATGAADEENDAIRFRASGQQPPFGSTVTINYYPVQSRPAPVTDLNIGSVARTLMESVARELSVEELLLEHVYESAFIDTAEGSNLDKVVALVGVRRRPAGVATTRLRFVRAPGSLGRIIVPTSTVASDADGNRYHTTAPLVIEPGEPSRAVVAAGISRSTPAVEANTLDRLEVLIAGVSGVFNDEPATAALQDSDADLRRRAKGALAVAAKGTPDALKFGVLSIPGVNDVAVVEFPNDVAGEIRIDIAYEGEPDSDLLQEVNERIEDLRPAGIRVLSARAQSLDVTVAAALTLAGSGVSDNELPGLKEDLERRVVEAVRSLAPGGTLRGAQAVLAALEDPRIVDVAFEFSTGGTPAATLTAPEGSVLRAVQPFDFTVDTESGESGPAEVIEVDILLPLHLAAGVTLGEAESALNTAAQDWISTRRAGAPIDVDGLLARLRDDTRYSLVRADTAVTTESASRFLQLADGNGVHEVSDTDQVLLRNLNLDVREGAV